MLFTQEWWFDGGFQDRIDEARRRCTRNRFPGVDPFNAPPGSPFAHFYNRLEARTIIYLRDGFSYEIKELIPRKSSSALTFECMPAEEAYKVGAFVVTLPYDDIVRVEVFAYPPDERPEDMPSIKGFSGVQGTPQKRLEDRPPRPESVGEQ
jgi:hypothetical protein